MIRYISGSPRQSVEGTYCPDLYEIKQKETASKQMTIKELKEQLQEDMISFLSDFIDQEEMDAICKIIVDRVNEFEESNKTESK